MGVRTIDPRRSTSVLHEVRRKNCKAPHFEDELQPCGWRLGVERVQQRYRSIDADLRKQAFPAQICKKLVKFQAFIIVTFRFFLRITRHASDDYANAHRRRDAQKRHCVREPVTTRRYDCWNRYPSSNRCLGCRRRSSGPMFRDPLVTNATPTPMTWHIDTIGRLGRIDHTENVLVRRAFRCILFRCRRPRWFVAEVRKIRRRLEIEKINRQGRRWPRLRLLERPASAAAASPTSQRQDRRRRRRRSPKNPDGNLVEPPVTWVGRVDVEPTRTGKSDVEVAETCHVTRGAAVSSSSRASRRSCSRSADDVLAAQQHCATPLHQASFLRRFLRRSCT